MQKTKYLLTVFKQQNIERIYTCWKKHLSVMYVIKIETKWNHCILAYVLYISDGKWIERKFFSSVWETAGKCLFLLRHFWTIVVVYWLKTKSFWYISSIWNIKKDFLIWCYFNKGKMGGVGKKIDNVGGCMDRHMTLQVLKKLVLILNATVNTLIVMKHWIYCSTLKEIVFYV